MTYAPTARAIVTFIVGPGMSMRLAAVGTDEGDIYLVTTEYASTYLASYRAHATPVYNIQWNNFIPTVFLSCAAEWTVKIWDMNYSKVRGHVRHVTHVTRHHLRPAPLHLRRGCAGGRRVLGALLQHHLRRGDAGREGARVRHDVGPVQAHLRPGRRHDVITRDT